MKRHRRNRTPDLELDAIYNSSDPQVQTFIQDVMLDEMGKAHERATLRVARQFRHLLPPSMQATLAARYPDAALAATA